VDQGYLKPLPFHKAAGRETAQSFVGWNGSERQ